MKVLEKTNNTDKAWLIIILFVFKKLDFKFYIRKIFAVYGLGFAADLVGIIYLFALSLIVSELPLSLREREP